MENSIITAEQIRQILELVKQYLVYIYPGFITFVIYRFAIARNVDESKNTIIKSIIISYFYTMILALFVNQTPTEFGIIQHSILLVVACVVPVIWNLVIKSKWFKTVLESIGINTEIYDNQIDILRYKEEAGVWVRVYMDELKIMYEGSLRHYESDMSKEQQIILSGYRFYVYDESKKNYIVEEDYANNEKQWVRILEKNITRMEFVYQENH